MKWIPVSERLPALKKYDTSFISKKFVHLYTEDGQQDIGALFVMDSGEIKHGGILVTHWMPLPEPPEDS